jgi:hypothetical protein
MVSMPEYREFNGGGSKKVPKNVWLIGGGLGVLVIAYMYHKSKTAKAATAPTDPNAIDPNTGLPYSSAGLAGFGGALNSAAGTTPSAYSYIDPATGTVVSGFGGQGGTVVQPKTNAQWFQQTEGYMITVLGYDPFTTSAALSKYLAGGMNGAGAILTPNEMSLVQTAWAAEGKPPVGVPEPHLASPPTGQTNPPATGRTAAQLANSAHLFAVYNNIVVHRKAAEVQYKAAPNQSNLNLLHGYQQSEKKAYDAYMASLR